LEHYWENRINEARTKAQFANNEKLRAVYRELETHYRNMSYLAAVRGNLPKSAAEIDRV